MVDKTDIESLKYFYEKTLNHQQQKIISLEHLVDNLQCRMWRKFNERFIKEDSQQRRLDFEGLELLSEEQEEVRLAREEVIHNTPWAIMVKAKNMRCVNPYLRISSGWKNISVGEYKFQ